MKPKCNKAAAGMYTVVFPFIGDEIGGSHVSCFTLAQELLRRGFSVIILCSKHSKISDYAAAYNLPIATFDEKTSPRHSVLWDIRCFFSRYRLMKTLKRNHAGCILHFNDISAMQSWAPIAKLLRIPIVYHHRSLNVMTFPKRALISLSDASIAISDITKRNISFLRDSNVHHILNPVSINIRNSNSQIRSETKSTYAVDEDKTLIGFVGNFWIRKRPLFLIETAKILISRGVNIHLIFFGRKGDYTLSDIADYATRNGISQSVSVAGFRQPVEPNIQALDLLAAPALREPFGRTLVEALLLGVPYVATADAGHVEIWDRFKGGLLVRAEASPTEFADTIEEALLKNLILSQTDLEVAQRLLSVVSHADSIENVYKSVLTPH